MKNLLHNIQILAMLALTMVGIQSCSDDLHDVGDVQVNFTATLPTDTRTRAFGKAEQVNTLIVGIFKKGVADVHTNNGGSWSYYEIDRQSFPINGTSVDVQLTLAQEQTYSFVFWAYDGNQNIYDIDDLTAIVMNPLPSPITFSEAEAMDAFFATMEDITITGDCSYPVELVRPLAQINVGTTGTPMQATFKAKAVPDTFYPFTNTVSGTADYTWNFSETTAETFSADGTEYNYLAMGYVLAPTTATKISAELTLKDGNARKTVKFPQVEIGANQRSNIAGDFTLLQEN
ncbi:hypothetical protein B5F83_00070 [Muribaculum sp. An289]|uniref:DUF6562 domain-containing protein n=1 Tax=unclassified Muribaculum TaxID=2622126 RepID=UPI000B36EA00|nr:MULTISPECIES: DUF6562 domain-containing protein [unclassified Muribaculum]OUO38306.1 hypothetical protein B5F83_00070 [Muribaculum sp. An289]OUO43856.1 hypothetical protein B5F81_01380 [Muribaculum sp. An287]